MTTQPKPRDDDHATSPAPRGRLVMALLGLLVGFVAGWGAIGFRALIGLFHNLLFLGQLSATYNANAHMPISPWGAGIILVPVIGAIGVAFLVKTFAPEAKGHGVPEVMDAIYYGAGRIRPIVAVIKSLASALSIGSGGSVGREGPIVQIGSAFGSSLGQWIPMPARQRVTLVAAGAGAGIAATFNTPIGGLMFAIELLLPAVNAATLLPVAIATVTATCVGRYVLGTQAAFDISELQAPAIQVLSPAAYPLFVVFGLLIGLLATLFVRSIYWSEDQFEKLPGNYYTRHMTGMLLVGLLMYGFMTYSGHYYIQGVGYASVEDVLRKQVTSPAFLLLLMAAKLLATNLTLGSGASGGVFSPSLFLGAMLGGSFGSAVEYFVPELGLGPATFAVVGMAGMIAGATGAIVTGITMLFEMTRDYNTILPVMLTVAIAYMVRKTLSPESIYTLKLWRRGHAVPEGLQAALDIARRAKHVMTREFDIRPLNTDQQSQTSVAPSPRNHAIAIPCQGHVILIPSSELEETEAASAAASISTSTAASDSSPPPTASPNYVIVGEHDSLGQVMAALDSQHAAIAVVSRNPKSTDIHDIVGVITMKQLLAALESSWKLFG